MMKLSFKPSLLPTLAFILILPCLIALGFWQLDRAAQKRAIIEGMTHALNDAPLTLTQALSDPAQYAYYGIQLEGRFLPGEDILLMHALEKGQPGYYVLSSFQTQYQGKPAEVLVNRGFVVRPAPSSSQVTLIHGIITRPQPKRFILGETVPEPSTKPLMVQRTDLEAISRVTGHTYLPIIVLADNDLGDGLLRHWQLTVMPPEKHLGYAVQWFGLGLCLVIIYIVVNVRRRP